MMEPVSALATWLLEQSGRLLDHAYRAGRERRAAQQAADRDAIDDTFEQLLDALAMIESVVDRDWERGRRAKSTWEDKRYPSALPELLCGRDIVIQLTDIVPGAMDALPRVPTPIRAKLGHVSNVVRAARRDQIDRVIAGKRPTVQTAEERSAMRVAGDRINRSLDRFYGVRVARLLIGR